MIQLHKNQHLDKITEAASATTTTTTTANVLASSMNADALSSLQTKPQKFDFSPEYENSEENESRLNVISVTSDISSVNDGYGNLSEINFKRKKSCILSNTYSTCVTKAINHLEALQNTIDTWMNRIERAIPDSASSAESSKRLMEFVRKRNGDSKAELKLNDKFDNLSEELIDMLSIKDAQHQLALIDKNQLVVHNNQEPLEDLKVGGILEEILMLIARLEHDRKRTELLLVRERENLNRLKTQIEKMALKRAVELPLKVQHEHDACITDITELNWHISFNVKAQRKLMRKVEIEERLHQQLKEEISNIKMNTPLIEEKIAIEIEIMKKILQAQKDVDDLLQKSRDRLAQTQEKSVVSKKQAAKERESIQADLSASKRELNKAKKRLLEAENMCKENLKLLEESIKTLEENNVQEKRETLRRVELRNKNESLNEESKKIKMDRFHVEKERERVREENRIQLEKINQMSEKFNAELEKLYEVLNKKSEKLEKILKKIQEKDIDLEEMTNDQKSMEYKIEKDERNRERLLDEKEKTENELRSVTASFLNAVKINKATINDQEKEMKRLEQREDLLRKQISDLKKQINEERHLTTTLNARMNAEAEDFVRNQVTAEQKKKQFEVVKAETDKKLADFQKKVNEIESIKIGLDDDVAELLGKLNNTISLHVNLEGELLTKIANLEPKHKQIFDEFVKQKSRLEYMRSHSSEMSTKMEEMVESKKVMVKTIEKTNTDIDFLENQFKEANTQCEATSYLHNMNKKSLEECQNRFKTAEINHKNLMDERNEYLNKLNSQLDDYLKVNKELASRYRALKYDMYNVKLSLLKQIEIKLNTYINVKDKRQLQSLQERMHFALKDYLQFKNRHSNKNYCDLSDETDQVGDQIESLEGLLNNSVNYVSRFLHNQIDFSQVRQLAMQKVHKEELIEQQNKQQNRHKQNIQPIIIKTDTNIMKKSNKSVGFNLVENVH